LADVAAERLGPSVFPVVIVQLGLRLEALGAYVADELALARVKFRVPAKQGGLVKALVAARMFATERLDHWIL